MIVLGWWVRVELATFMIHRHQPVAVLPSSLEGAAADVMMNPPAVLLNPILWSIGLLFLVVSFPGKRCYLGRLCVLQVLLPWWGFSDELMFDYLILS